MNIPQLNTRLFLSEVQEEMDKIPDLTYFEAVAMVTDKYKRTNLYDEYDIADILPQSIKDLILKSATSNNFSLKNKAAPQNAIPF